LICNTVNELILTGIEGSGSNFACLVYIKLNILNTKGDSTYLLKPILDATNWCL